MHHYYYIEFVKLLRVLLFYIFMSTFQVVNSNPIAFLCVLELLCPYMSLHLQFTDTTIVNIYAELVGCTLALWAPVHYDDCRPTRASNAVTQSC